MPGPQRDITGYSNCAGSTAARILSDLPRPASSGDDPVVDQPTLAAALLEHPPLIEPASGEIRVDGSVGMVVEARPVAP